MRYDTSAHRLAETEEVALAVLEPRAPLTDSLAGIVSGNFGDAINCLESGKSYSSNATPRAFSAAMVASISTTSHPIWVWLPDASPADSNKAKKPLPLR
jgi:hypothetical protein